MFLKDAILFWVLHYGSSDSRTSRSLAMISVHLIFRYTDSSAAIAALCISVESFLGGESHLFRSLSQHNRIILKMYFIFLKQILCLPVSFIKMFLSWRCTIDESTHNCSTRYAQGKLCIILLHLATPSNFGGHMSYCHFSDAQFYHRRNIIIKQSTDKVLQLGVFLAENLPMNLFFDVAGAGYPGG